MKNDSLQKYDCDRCGFTFVKKDLLRQKGLLVCNDCFDAPDPSSRVEWGFYGAQSGTDKTVSTITAVGGITRSEYHMLIQGDGAITVSATPQIAVGTDKQLLVLEGYSDTNTITLADGNGLQLRAGKGITLKKGTIIAFVYNESSSLWVETSRSDFYGQTIKGSYI